MNTHSENQQPLTVYTPLAEYIAEQQAASSGIPEERKQELEVVAKYIEMKLAAEQDAQLIFICTHNSRRSHFSQIWAQVAASLYGLSGVTTFSGGTEVTALNERVVSSLQRSGFEVSCEDVAQQNPRYAISYADNRAAIQCFSKRYDDAPNPTKDYCAIMTCAGADESCPVVHGCELRVAIRYVDPKIADETDRESETYDERSRQICREMLYLMELAKDRLNNASQGKEARDTAI